MIEDHKHCIVCGKATGAETFFCSPSCEELFKNQRKRMARSRMLMLALFIGMFVVVMVISTLGS